MNMLETIVNEMSLCLVVTWILGFLTAWIIKRHPNKDLKEEISELREDLRLKSTYSRGLEKENAHKDILLKEYKNNTPLQIN